ncbi:hypothetical protein D3C73_1070620 [compost metagenome]
MFAKGVEAVVLDAVVRVGKHRAHVLGEDVVTQTLDLLDFFSRARQAHRQHFRGVALPGFSGITAWGGAC